MMTAGMAGFGWIFMILFWMPMIVGVVALAKWLLSADGAGEHAGRGALDTLKERYARGEVSRDQYEAMRQVLES